MSNDFNSSFEIAILLKHDDFEIRTLAIKNASKTLGDFNVSMNKLAYQAPFILDILMRVATQSSDKADFQSLIDFKLLLEGTGCKKFAPHFNDIIEECRKGNKSIAASRAKQISHEFGNMIKRISLAKKNPKPSDEKGIVNSDNTEETEINNINQPLKQVLERMERTEATRKLKILVVDDAPVIIKTISAILGDEYKIYGMTNPTMMEKFLQQITPVLILLDYKMPELNGFDLIPIIRGFAEHKNTPIIFLTSMGTSDHVSAAVMLGACDFLVKPVQPDILRGKIAKHIVRKRLF